MPGPTITVRGQHTERASAEHAALTISIDAEDDGSSAVKTVQGIVSDLAALLLLLAPGLPPLNGTAKTSHPSPEAGVESYTFMRIRVADGPSKSFASKTTLRKSGPAPGRTVRASTRAVVSFRDLGVLEQFALHVITHREVMAQSIAWSLSRGTERRLRRAARTGALGAAYERAWDLATAGVGLTGPPGDCPSTEVHANAFSLRLLEAHDVTDAPSLTASTILRTMHLHSGKEERTIDPASFEPPELGFTAGVEAKYAVA